MIDWGISGVIVAVIAFVVSEITEVKLKRLTNKVVELEKALAEKPAEVMTDDGGNSADI